MKKMIPNKMFLKNTMPEFVEKLNSVGVKAVCLEDGFEYDYDEFVNYAKTTPLAKMPLMFVHMRGANLRWLLGDMYDEIYDVA